jgi:hypothetical protein
VRSIANSVIATSATARRSSRRKRDPVIGLRKIQFIPIK